MVTKWMEMLLPEVEKILGPFTRLEDVTIIDLSGADPRFVWSVDIIIFDDTTTETIFIYNEDGVDNLYFSPPEGDPPKPNVPGRIIADMIHDICHLYQAEGMDNCGLAKKFENRGYDLSVEGMAEFVTFLTIIEMLKKARDNPTDLPEGLSDRETISFVVKNKGYKKELEELVLWQMKYSFRTAFKNGLVERVDDFSPLQFLSGPMAKKVTELLSGLSESFLTGDIKAKYEKYDLGIFLGAELVRKHKFSVKDLIFSPLPDKKLVGLIEKK